MEYINYNPVNEKNSCIVRSLSKAYNKDYYEIKNELIDLSEKLNYEDYREIDVFESYLLSNNAVITDKYNNKIIKDLDLEKGIYVIFCYKDNFYHMVTVIDNKLYDKDDSSLELTVLKTYKINEQIIHKMKLHDEPFQLIKMGIKNIEMRLNDEKRSLIKIGDIIEFTNRKDSDIIKVKVTNLFKYDSFYELYNEFDKVSLGYDKNQIANPKDMEIYYSKEEQEKYGVLAIEIKLI